MILSVEKVTKLVEAEISNIESSKFTKSLYAPISYIMSLGGKRLRPVMSVFAYSLFKDNIDAALKPAVALEYFHNFTLMHDDIMDNAPLRRGKTTVHEKWNSNTAILSGDAMLIKTYQLFENINDLEIYNSILERFNKTALEVCEGQMLDMEFEKRSDISLFEYIEMIRLKTSVLLGFSLELGALLAKQDSQVALKLYSVGVNAGIAFQIKDDYLDLFGEAAQVGKKIGGDVIANKKTYLLVKLLELVNSSDKKLVLNWLSKSEFDENEKISFFKSMFAKYDIKALAEKEMNDYFETAMQQLDSLKVDLVRRGSLKRILLNLINREK